MGDADRAIDELLNLVVGEELFAKSVFIEDKLTASQHLRNFDSKQEQILKQCQERHLNEQRQQEQRRGKSKDARKNKDAQKNKDVQKNKEDKKKKIKELLLKNK